MILLEHVARALALAGLAFGYGVALKLSDLLQEHGYRWFRGSAFVTGLAAAALGVGLLALAHAELRLLFLAVIVSWILRGRVDGPNHGVMAAAMLLALLAWGPSVPLRWPVFAYFASVLFTLGAVHDLLQYGRLKAPRPVTWFFENQHLYWYLMAGCYCFFFELDPVLVLTVYGFVKGYGWLYDEGRRARLARWGIRRAPTESTDPDA